MHTAWRGAFASSEAGSEADAGATAPRNLGEPEPSSSMPFMWMEYVDGIRSGMDSSRGLSQPDAPATQIDGGAYTRRAHHWPWRRRSIMLAECFPNGRWLASLQRSWSRIQARCCVCRRRVSQRCGVIVQSLCLYSIVMINCRWPIFLLPLSKGTNSSCDTVLPNHAFVPTFPAHPCAPTARSDTSSCSTRALYSGACTS